MNPTSRYGPSYDILIVFEGRGDVPVTRSGTDEWGRPRNSILIAAWKRGFAAHFLPRPGDAISSSSLGEGLTSHLDRPVRVNEVLHSPLPPERREFQSEKPHDNQPSVVVEIRQKVDGITAELVAAIENAGWQIV